MFERCECGPDPTSKTFEWGIDKFGNYYEKNIQDQNTIIEKNIQGHCMTIGDLGDTSGPITTDEPPWLREWISPRPREDDSSSGGEPEGLIDSSSEEDFGNTNPEEGDDPSDLKDGDD